MRHIDAIEQAIAFTEAHLREDIGVGDMAAAVAYSLSHFCRTFNQVTHHTPYDYLIRRRLAEAARELLQGNRRIGDIAADYYFNSPETFARAFRRVFGMLPTSWRTRGALDPQLLMPRLTRAHLLYVQQGYIRRPTLEAYASLQLAGVMTLVHAASATIGAKPMAGCRSMRVDGSLQRVGKELVRSNTKTESSQRTLPVPEPVVRVLRAHLKRLEAERLSAGDDWEEQGYLFPTERGTPVEPSNLIRHFKAALKRAGLPETTRFHNLRHWCASLLISYKVHPKAIQEILGHANITTTLNVYGHLLPNVLRDAADQMAGLAGEDAETLTPDDADDDQSDEDDEDDEDEVP